jgi:uncharacterized protein YndB with AHSA1/START domain
MTSNLQFDFTIDRATNSILVKKEFAAARSLVWDAFTKKDMLDRWWAPKPWVSRTRVMDFKAGGRRVYAMVGPEGQEHWSVQAYTSIDPKTNFKYVSSFIDKDENPNDFLPAATWDLNFSERNGTTTVSIDIKLNSLADLEKHIQMGFQGGFTMTLNFLETLLDTLK